MEFEMVYWHWLILGMFLMMLEMALPSFTALWFGSGALLVGGLLWLFPELGLEWQIFIWTVVSSLLTWLWFRYLRPLSVDKTKAGLSREAILGEMGRVLSVPNGKKRGKLRFPAPILGSDEWPIMCNEELAIGDRVSVIDVSGNTLVVRKQS